MKKTRDYSDRGSNVDTALNTDYTQDVVDLSRDIRNILDVLSDIGHTNALRRNDNTLTGMAGTSWEKDGLITSFQILQKPRLKGTGEYNTAVGVMLKNKSIRYMDFHYAKETWLEALEIDSILDKDIVGNIADATNDYARILIEDEEMKWFEQYTNSAEVIVDSTKPTGINTFYDRVGLDFDYPVIIDSMTDEELLDFTYTIKQHFDNAGFSRETPVLIVTPAMYARYARLKDEFIPLPRTQYEDYFRNMEIGMVQGCTIVKYNKMYASRTLAGDDKLINGLPANIDIMALMPGFAISRREMVRPVKIRNRTSIKDPAFSGNELIDAEFLTGTFQQFVYVTDNLDKSNGETLFTETCLLFNLKGQAIVQDPSVVLRATIQGDEPAVVNVTNRTLNNHVDAIFDNTQSSESPATISAAGASSASVSTKEVDYSVKTLSELKAIADKNGVEYPGNASKAILVDLIKEME